MRRTLALCLTLLILWAVVAELNHALSEWRVYIFAASLFVCFASVTQTWATGFATAAFAGLMHDANSPVIFGTHVLLFLVGHITLAHIRDRVPRDDAISATVLTLLTNLALFLVFSFTQIHGSPAAGIIWPRLLMDLLCSQIFIAVVTPWFFALQSRALAIAQPWRGETA